MLTTAAAIADDSTKQTVNSGPLSITVLLGNQSLRTQCNYLLNNFYNGLVTEFAYKVIFKVSDFNQQIVF